MSPARPADPARLILLAVLFFLAAVSFEAADWAEGLWILRWITVGGVLVAYLLILARLPSLLTHLIGALAGLGWTLALVLRLIGAPSWRLGLEDIAYRMLEWGQAVLSGGQGDDNLIFVVLLSGLMWHLAEGSAWALFRLDNPWLPAAAAASIVVANAHYGVGVVTLHVGLVLVLGLALVLLTHLRLRERGWQQAQVRYDPEIGWHLLRQGLTWTVVLAVVAFLAPAPGEQFDLSRRLSALEEPFSRLQEEWNRLFTALNYRRTAEAVSFGDRLVLGGPPRRSEDVVFEVQSSRASYWRANVYHSYTGRGWRNTDTERQSWTAVDPRHRVPPEALREPLTQVFRIRGVFEQVIFAAPQPAQIQYPVRAFFSELPESVQRRIEGGAVEVTARDEPGYPFVDVSTFHPRRSLHPGDEYTAVSLVSMADKRSLRRAGADYPAWVTERYLQLPETVSDRTRALAHEIAAPFENPYDQAEAVQGYLRQMEYEEEVVGPPPGADGVDYFLFDLQKGFCDYYATAMAVMLRTLGIPARVAAGYAPGAYDEVEGVWRVRDADGHSWVEAYFPGYGWIEFEPTPLRPVPGRPEEPPPSEPGEASPPEAEPERERPDLSQLNLPEDEGGLGDLPFFQEVGRPAVWLGVSGLVVALVAGSVLVWWLELRPGRSAGETYRRFLRWTGLLGLARRDWQDPGDHARAVARRWPPTSGEAEALAGLYAAERFGGRAGLAAAADQVWRRLRRRVLLGLLPRVRWGEPPDPGEER